MISYPGSHHTYFAPEAVAMSRKNSEDEVSLLFVLNKNKNVETQVSAIKAFALQNSLEFIHIDNYNFRLKGTVAQINLLFKTDFVNYIHEGKTYYATNLVEIPEVWATVTTHVMGVDNYPRFRHHSSVLPIESQNFDYTTKKFSSYPLGAGITGPTGPKNVYTSPQVAQIYNFPSGNGAVSSS
jgi:hypothetical protein